MRRIRQDSPEKAAERMARFLMSPPSRISAEKVAKRKYDATRKAMPPGLADRLAAIQGWKCHYCRRPMRAAHSDWPDRATVDHRLPVSRGGTNHKANTVAACARCNTFKGSMTEREFARAALAASGEAQHG